jgi:hypothetical protein
MIDIRPKSAADPLRRSLCQFRSALSLLGASILSLVRKKGLAWPLFVNQNKPNQTWEPIIGSVER